MPAARLLVAAFKCTGDGATAPANGTVSFSAEDMHGSVATFSCQQGFSYSGDASITCDAASADAPWPTPSAPPTCTESGGDSAPEGGGGEGGGSEAGGDGGGGGDSSGAESSELCWDMIDSQRDLPIDYDILDADKMLASPMWPACDAMQRFGAGGGFHY